MLELYLLGGKCIFDKHFPTSQDLYSQKKRVPMAYIRQKPTSKYHYCTEKTLGIAVPHMCHIGAEHLPHLCHKGVTSVPSGL